MACGIWGNCQKIAHFDHADASFRKHSALDGTRFIFQGAVQWERRYLKNTTWLSSYCAPGWDLIHPLSRPMACRMGGLVAAKNARSGKNAWTNQRSLVIPKNFAFCIFSCPTYIQCQLHYPTTRKHKWLLMRICQTSLHDHMYILLIIIYNKLFEIASGHPFGTFSAFILFNSSDCPN